MASRGTSFWPEKTARLFNSTRAVFELVFLEVESPTGGMNGLAETARRLARFKPLPFDGFTARRSLGGCFFWAFVGIHAATAPV
jgi:hypothetical protein